MLHAWCCGGPFVVPVCDLILTFGLILYISIEWIEGIFQITGVTRIPAVILPTWTPPANALGSLWLPVVFCTAFLLLVLYVARMLVQVKHARNPLQPGVKHFIFGFTVLLVLGFAGLCGLLALDVVNAIQVFGVGVNCTPLAGVVNPACLQAKKYFADRHLHSIVLLTLLILVGAFGIFGEIIIVWSVLRLCIFGSQLHTCHQLRLPACTSPCIVPGTVVHPHGSRPREHRGCRLHQEEGYCVPIGGSRATQLAFASGRSPAAAAVVGDEDIGACVFPSEGAASSRLPASRTVTAHTQYTNPLHASCPLEADTQQRLGIENPVANTCKISINTGRQEKKAHNPRVTRVVVGDSTSSSSSEEECRKRRRVHKHRIGSAQRRNGRIDRRRPHPPSSSSESPPHPRGRPPCRPPCVPPPNRTSTHRTSTKRCPPAGGPVRTSLQVQQRRCNNRCCSAKPACTQFHLQSCKRQKPDVSAALRRSSSCRHAADTCCNARRRDHSRKSFNGCGAVDAASVQMLRSASPHVKSGNCCLLPACPADWCPADASPVGVSPGYSNRQPLSRSMQGRRRFPGEAAASPKASLPTRYPPIQLQTRRQSTSAGYGGPRIRSHSSCPRVYTGRQITGSAPPTYRRALAARTYQGPALIRDHRSCEMQGYRDRVPPRSASWKRYPSAPPYLSHNVPSHTREPKHQPRQWYPTLQGLSHQDARGYWPYGKTWMSAVSECSTSA